MSDEAENKKEPDTDEATARAAKRRRAARKRRAAGKRADNGGTAATSAKRKRRKRNRPPQAQAQAAPSPSPVRRGDSTEDGSAEDERRLAKLMVAAAATLILGLAIVGTGASDIGGPLTIVGLLALVASIHFYGRLGAGGYRRHNGEAPLSQR